MKAGSLWPLCTASVATNFDLMKEGRCVGGPVDLCLYAEFCDSRRMLHSQGITCCCGLQVKFLQLIYITI